MWILYTFLWPWVHAQSCLCTPPDPAEAQRGPATVLHSLSDWSEGTQGIPHIPRPHREGKQSAAGTGKVALGRERTVAVIQWNQPTCLNGSQNDAL